MSLAGFGVRVQRGRPLAQVPMFPAGADAGTAAARS